MVVVVVVVVLMVETPLTVPDLIGSPPLVVFSVLVSPFSGVLVGVGLGVTLGVGVALGVAEAEGDGVNLFMNLVVALKVRYPRVPSTMIVRIPAMNDFMSYIIYQGVKFDN